MATVGAFITITNPEQRGDLYKECIKSALGFVDELVVVDGGSANKGSADGSIEWIQSLRDNRIKIVRREWPDEFHWLDIAAAFQMGYDSCSSDYVMHLDCDFIIHERDYARVRSVCDQHVYTPALSMWKYQFVLPDRYHLKSRLILLVNKKAYGSRIKFDGGGEQDFCQPSLDGRYLSPDDVPEAQIPFYNYEKILKTRLQVSDDQGRMERAWRRHFGEYQMGSDGTNESAYEKWIAAQKGKLSKPHKHILIGDHPTVVQQTILGLEPHQFGYNGFGELEKNDYIREDQSH